MTNEGFDGDMERGIARRKGREEEGGTGSFWQCWALEPSSGLGGRDFIYELT